MGSLSTTDELMDVETDAISSDATDEAGESDIEPMCFSATTTGPGLRRLRWRDVTYDESDSEISQVSPRTRNTGLAPTLLQSAFAEQGMEKSASATKAATIRASLEKAGFEFFAPPQMF